MGSWNKTFSTATEAASYYLNGYEHDEFHSVIHKYSVYCQVTDNNWTES